MGAQEGRRPKRRFPQALPRGPRGGGGGAKNDTQSHCSTPRSGCVAEEGAPPEKEGRVYGTLSDDSKLARQRSREFRVHGALSDVLLSPSPPGGPSEDTLRQLGGAAGRHLLSPPLVEEKTKTARNASGCRLFSSGVLKNPYWCSLWCRLVSGSTFEEFPHLWIGQWSFN